MSKKAEVTVSITAIAADVRALVSAYGAVEKAAVKVANAVRAIGNKITPDQLNDAASMIKTALEPVLSESSLKSETTRIKGVLRAMVGGYEPDENMGLRAMYNEAGKGTGRQKAGARHGGKSDGGNAEPITVKATPEQQREIAIRTLFGHHDAALASAIEWAVSHEAQFVAYVSANVKAAQAAEAEKLAGKASAPVKAAPRKRATRKAA